MLIADAPVDAPTAEAVMARAASENFPVASRMLPARVRAHLLAIYGFARLVDEIGDRPAPAMPRRPTIRDAPASVWWRSTGWRRVDRQSTNPVDPVSPPAWPARPATPSTRCSCD